MKQVEDNFPYAALEALERGCFVFASKVGGLIEMADWAPGFCLIEAGNPDAWAKKMGEWAVNGGSQEGIGRQNHAVMLERFSPEISYRRLMKTYGFDKNSPFTEKNLPRR